MKIIIAVIALYIIVTKGFDIATRKYINPYRLYFIFGKKGSGKTTYMVKRMIRYVKKGWNVYTDIKNIGINGVRIFDVKKFGPCLPPRNTILFFGEAGITWDNRKFKEFSEEVRDAFKLSRHLQLIIVLDSQDFDIDKKIRSLVDVMYLQVNVLRVFTVGKRIVRKVTLTESTSEAESRIADNLKFTPFYNWTITFIPKYVKYFNSYDSESKPELPYKEITEGRNVIKTKRRRRPAGKRSSAGVGG